MKCGYLSNPEKQSSVLKKKINKKNRFSVGPPSFYNLSFPPIVRDYTEQTRTKICWCAREVYFAPKFPFTGPSRSVLIFFEH